MIFVYRKDIGIDTSYVVADDISQLGGCIWIRMTVTIYIPHVTCNYQDTSVYPAGSGLFLINYNLNLSRYFFGESALQVYNRACP